MCVGSEGRGGVHTQYEMALTPLTNWMCLALLARSATRKSTKLDAQNACYQGTGLQ